jgi:hypothetical protein
MHIGDHLALGGGGVAGLIIHLFIWHEVWRLVRLLWHIHTVGPFIVIALGLLLAATLVWRRSHRIGGYSWGRRRSGSAGYGTGSGPRDW